MKKPRRYKAESNIKLAFLFFAFIFSAVFVSFLIKGILIAKTSIYDGSGRFNLQVSNSKDSGIISFSKPSGTISILKIDGDSKDINLGQLLGIPIDGFLKSSSLDLDLKVSYILSQSLLKYRSFPETNLTIFDILRLFLFSRSVSKDSVKTQSISPKLSVSKIDKVLYRFFNDEVIEKDADTIEIINGTDVLGLGNRLARVITNMGGDVIVVKTAESTQDLSLISYTKKDNTVRRLGKFLKFKSARREDKALADITIVIGKDHLSSLSF